MAGTVEEEEELGKGPHKPVEVLSQLDDATASLEAVEGLRGL